LFLDKNFQHGHSRANPLSTTYSSPQLSGKEDFLVDEVEVWMIRERNVDSIEYKKSILEGNSEAKALLEMSGKQIYSEGFRGPLGLKPPSSDCD
jgi:TLD